MTTFKNNSKYAELPLIYMDIAIKGNTPLTVEGVLKVFKWRFKGGSLRAASLGSRLQPATSSDVYPDGLSSDIAEEWPKGKEARALRRILMNRVAMGRVKKRAVLGRIGSYLTLTGEYKPGEEAKEIYSGMASIYHIFGLVWDWAQSAGRSQEWGVLGDYMDELVVAASSPSKVDVPSARARRAELWAMLEGTCVPALMRAVLQLKELISQACGRRVYAQARALGSRERETWGPFYNVEACGPRKVGVDIALPSPLRVAVGPCQVVYSQECAMVGLGARRYALSKGDMERLHQLTMSATSGLLGVCAQAVVGTEMQKRKAQLAVGVAVRNIARIVASSRLCPLGEEVLICKGYRRAYTAHLGWLAGSMCQSETVQLIKEAEETASPGVLDIQGFLMDARMLDAASSLNAAKMFKICPAPDVSPGLAMMDRIKQIGNGNIMDPKVREEFTGELRAQILRAYIRSSKKKLKLRQPNATAPWYGEYLRGEYDDVPTDQIHQYLAWEGTAEMPDISPYDAKHWKDSGLGADTRWEAERKLYLGRKGNMITRLVFDEECPMPGRTVLNDEHIIKFFIKAEGHKDPARGIFSANLTDRQAQSWMELAVEKVARHHPSYMIGQGVDVRDAKVALLTAKPTNSDWLAMYYSFDISGWSAKMPGLPQRISHSLWGDLYGGHLFRRAHELNEDAHIYLNMEGYKGWFTNTAANLEGFNGKEMTMILIALLSLSVKRWRTAVVEQRILTEPIAKATAALLFAYIDDGLCRIELPRSCAVRAFDCYKRTVIGTFSECGFSVEVSKCFPSDRFAIFLNEVYLAGRHVIHGVRAAMGISAEPTERHTTLVERIGSVTSGCRGAVMAGLNPLSAIFLMAYHSYLHIREWTTMRDPVVLAVWSVTPRTWGGLGMPNVMQIYVSGSGAAFEEGVSTLQAYSKYNVGARKVFCHLSKGKLIDRSATSVLTAPLSGRVREGYMVDSRVGVCIRRALRELMDEGRLSTYAMRLLKYADDDSFNRYADAVVPLNTTEVLQEQMLDNVADAHPHRIFSAFATRLEKSETVRTILGSTVFFTLLATNRSDVAESMIVIANRMKY